MGQKAYHILPIIMKVQIKMGCYFTHIRISLNFDLDNFNTILVGASVGRTTLDNVLFISNKDIHPLDLGLPLRGASSRDSVALIPRKIFPAVLQVIAKFGNT